MIGHFDNGKKHGGFEQWYDDGASRHRELIATFDQDKYVGKYREWYENGKRSIWGFYIDGKEHGRYTEWYDSCLLYTSPSPRDFEASRMPSSA